MQAQSETRKKKGKRGTTAAPLRSQALRERQEVVHAAASLGGERMGSLRQSESHSDQESMSGSACCSSHDASDSLPQITLGTSNEILRRVLFLGRARPGGWPEPIITVDSLRATMCKEARALKLLNSDNWNIYEPNNSMASVLTSLGAGKYFPKMKDQTVGGEPRALQTVGGEPRALPLVLALASTYNF
ncbi:hypothetical protein NDU88_010552 [Pleurodeles waltl]|uniref:Uncharacterized protein n=1 Tax=Pleurodeles waltl TaxID=8319 RepID=A0AAV7QYB2_PLEWA|nr:hypothetical protein NDU88_010552 [Pleurodeles waltl]